MKKIIAVLLAVIIALCTMSGCANTAQTDNKINIVTTVFPIFDWVRELTEDVDNVEVTYLLSGGVDMHSYQPSVDDIISVSTADMVVYVGGESDEWVDDALREAVNKDIVTVNLIDVLGKSAKTEEIADGMQGIVEDDGIDEHVWLSINNARKFVTEISENLAVIDPENSGLYRKNTTDYLKKLDNLHDKFREAIDRADYNTVVFADRFPFRYLFDDFGLNYFAAFVGCSAETEANFDTITFLANKIDESGIGSIVQTETANGSIAKTVREATRSKNQNILTLNSIQSVSRDDLMNGATYLSIMEDNLNVLSKALYKE
ncbi:MAG: zinc ABC transporter substrate-binding protein [Ruminococcus sp.]|nr:zinc ABC transporter substrate-binding protein [Ruminococcus sp.]